MASTERTMIRCCTLPVVAWLAIACSRDNTQIATLSAATVPLGGIGDSTVTTRRLEVDSGRILYSAPSRDGRFMSGLDFKTGNVAIRDLGTGEIRLLTTAADWSTTYREAEAPIMSPNGKLVVYAWQNDAPSYDYELRLIGTDGVGERVLVRPNAAFREEYPLDWTPDSRSVLAALYGKDGGVQLALVSVAGGAVKVLRSFDWRGPTSAKISPDGAWIAYDFQPDQRRDAHEVFLMRLSDGREARVTSDGVPKSVIGWSANGDGVFYQTRRNDAVTIWYAPLREGRAAGPARVMRSDLWGADVRGIANGTLYYSVSDVRQAIYDVGVDLDRGRIVAPPTTIASGTFMRGPAPWSPDGHQIAFVRVLDGQRFALIIRDVASGQERELPLRLQYGEVTQWLPDGRAVLMRAWQRNQWASFRVDLASGKAELLTPLTGGERVELSRDGRTEYRTRNLGAPLDSGVVLVRNLATGAERELYRGGQVFGPRLSPDGKTLAFVREAADSSVSCCGTFAGQAKGLQLVVMPASGGNVRVLFTGGVGPASLNWSADGRDIVFGGGERTTGGTTFHLSVVTVATGHVQKLLSQRDQTGGPRLSPDGRHVTFWNTVGGKTRELWAMEKLPGGPSR
jgi:Tol biopolymer transport system component